MSDSGSEDEVSQKKSEQENRSKRRPRSGSDSSDSEDSSDGSSRASDAEVAEMTPEEIAKELWRRATRSSERSFRAWKYPIHSIFGMDSL